MLHIPVNHHLRQLYRIIAALVGVFTLVFGIVGFVEAQDLAFYAREGLPRVFLLPTNPAFAVASIVMGAILVLAAVIGRNLDHYVNLGAGTVFMVVGLVMLALLQTDANVLGWSMSNVVASFILGLIVFTAGLYGRSGGDEAADARESFRHGAVGVGR